LTIYADTSFFVSIYIADSHSAVADQLLATQPNVWLTPLHRAEWTHAIAQQVFRRQLSITEAERVHRELEKDRASGLWSEVALPEKAFDLCVDLARRYGPKLGVRTVDSLHIACALELKADRFWTFDERQAKLAKAEGLKTN
jgi:predicted nucleic acid-binding protein